MHEFGEIVIIKDYHLKGKLTNKGHHCMFLGYEDYQSGNIFIEYDLKLIFLVLEEILFC